MSDSEQDDRRYLGCIQEWKDGLYPTRDAAIRACAASDVETDPEQDDVLEMLMEWF